MLRLTDDELVVLDGRCTPETQAKVDAAKARVAARTQWPDVPETVAGFLADALTEARENGELVLWNTQLDLCGLCGSRCGYVPFKSGPRRGEPNYKRPISLSGYELARRFVTLRGHVRVGGCTSCVDPVVPVLAEALRGVPAQVPDRLRADGEPRRTKHQHRRCTSCGWTGHEGQMIRRRTILGDGTYPAECPSCGAGNGLGRSLVEIVDGFTIVEEG